MRTWSCATASRASTSIRSSLSTTCARPSRASVRSATNSSRPNRCKQNFLESPPSERQLFVGLECGGGKMPFPRNSRDLLWALVLLGCGGSSITPPDDGGAQCGAGETSCSGACVSTQTDVAHCGACDIAC